MRSFTVQNNHITPMDSVIIKDQRKDHICIICSEDNTFFMIMWNGKKATIINMDKTYSDGSFIDVKFAGKSFKVSNLQRL